MTDVAVQLQFRLQMGPRYILLLKASLSFLCLEVFSCWRGKTSSLSKLLWTSVILLGPVRHHRTNSPGPWVKDFSKTKATGINLNPTCGVSYLFYRVHHFSFEEAGLRIALRTPYVMCKHSTELHTGPRKIII